MKYPKLWTAAVLGCIGDVATTSYGILVLGLPEVNPLVVAIMGSFGIVGGVVLSKIIVLLAAVILAKYMDSAGWAAPAAVAVVYGVVVILNTIAIVL